jgi:hypothetical protein
MRYRGRATRDLWPLIVGLWIASGFLAFIGLCCWAVVLVLVIRSSR